MKKNLCVIIVFMLIILTGCTSDFKVDENAVKDISDRITEKVIEKVGTEKIEKKDTHTVDASNSTELVINSMVGDINITGQESTEAVIDANIIANSNNKEAAEKLLKNYTYTAESKWKTIKVDTTQYEDNMDTNDGIKVTLNIKIPSTIKKITITNSVGNIETENIYGELKTITNVGDVTVNNSNASYNLKTDVGNININNCLISGKSEFIINTGDVKISSTDISDAKNINVESQVGDIHMTLPESSSYKADINEFMKKQRIEIKGDGKTNIKLYTNVGEIDFK